jgi:hypothetical protein
VGARSHCQRIRISLISGAFIVQYLCSRCTVPNFLAACPLANRALKATLVVLSPPLTAVPK